MRKLLRAAAEHLQKKCAIQILVHQCHCEWLSGAVSLFSNKAVFTLGNATKHFSI